MLRLAACLLLLSAAPLAAQTISFGGEGRFGVAYEGGDDPQTRALARADYHIRLDHQLDNGVRLGFTLSVGAGNFHHRDGRDPFPLAPRPTQVQIGIGAPG